MITNEQARVAALASHVAYDNLGAYVGLVSAGYEETIGDGPRFNPRTKLEHSCSAVFA